MTRRNIDGLIFISPDILNTVSLLQNLIVKYNILTMQNLKFKNTIAFVLSLIGGVLIVLATFPACVETIAFNRDFYNFEYNKLNTHTYVGIDKNTLINATNILLDYLQEKRPNLNYTTLINSENREYYTNREKNHMVDVLALNKNALTFTYVSYITGAVLVLFSYFFAAKKYLTLKGFFYGILTVIIFFTAVGIFIAVDFNGFWINFHHVFFTNDLWMLDPAQSLMIRMFESDFFLDMSICILAMYLSIICAILATTYILYKKLKKKWAITQY